LTFREHSNAPSSTLFVNHLRIQPSFDAKANSAFVLLSF
jgi:hypothetical protein